MKKRNFLLIALVAVFSAALFFACSKDDEKTKIEMITSGSWRMTAATCEPAIPGVGNNIFVLMESCQKDNIYTFNANGTKLEDEGATKCNPDDPQTVNGTWEFAENETKVILDKNTENEMTLTIISLSESQALFSTPDFMDGFVVTFTFTKN